MGGKKILIGIILIWLITSVIPSALSAHTLGKTIITVDDEPGDADYTTINEAVNHSAPGTIIEIYSGMYDEQKIVISIQNLTLKGIPHELGSGNDTGKPVIKSSQIITGPFLSIKADSFSLLGCVLIGSQWLRSELYAESASHMVLSNNDISGGLSVYLDSCDYLQILNNTLTTGDTQSSIGLTVWYCDSALIQNNTLQNGPKIYTFFSRNCSIISNQVTNTTADTGIEVNDDESVAANATVSQNTVTNCSQTGIRITAINISVTNNHVSDCQTGIVIDTGFSRIENNTIERCHFGLNLSCGLGDYYPAQNTLTCNQIQNNSIGVILHQVGQKIIQVTRNNFIYNHVQVIVTAVVPVSSNNIFRENYWNTSLAQPKPVLCLGLIIIWFPPLGLFIGIPLPWICFDLSPAQHPYEIP